MLDPTAPTPSVLRHGRFVATPLTTDLAPLDHAAYVASPDVIRIHSDGRWPLEGFTLADDTEIIATHEADHEIHRAFTFALLDPAMSEALGCLYLNPLREYLQVVGAEPRLLGRIPTDAAMVTFWLRQDQQDTGLADVVVPAVDEWLVTEWPLSCHCFRILPDEQSSRAALEHSGLQRISVILPGEPRPYLWYSAPVADLG